jgi:hypothetical protein
MLGGPFPLTIRKFLSLARPSELLALGGETTNAGLVKYRRAFPRKKVCSGTDIQKLPSSEAIIWCTDLQCCFMRFLVTHR